MRTRAYDWLNTRTMKPMFGVQVHIQYLGWVNVIEKGKPCLYKTEADRDAKRAELRRMKVPPP